MTLGDLVNEMAGSGTQQVAISQLGSPAETVPVQEVLTRPGADPASLVSQLDNTGTFAVFGDAHLVIRPLPHGLDALKGQWTKAGG